MFPDTGRVLLALLALAGYALLCAGYWRKAKAAAAVSMPAAVDGVWQVVFASQTGSAEAIARQTLEQLRRGGCNAISCTLDQLTAAHLAAGGRFLFVLSTAGEGEAPDNGSRFFRRCDQAGLDLSAIDYGLLALGDRNYACFNAFGRRVDAWLAAAGARRSFDAIELDRCDGEGLSRWRRQISRLAGAPELADWVDTGFQSWRLVDREHLNPGSQGGAVYRLRFCPPEALSAWQAGDLAQVIVPADPGHPREYSIASIPSEGDLMLLVRLHERADGSPGLASSHLCHALAIGDSVRMRIRPHPAFRLAGNLDRPLILIASGVGLAGVRAHLQARIACGRHDNWLIFGERQAALDDFCGPAVDAAFHAGELARLDKVFSRQGGALRYVQDVLRQAAEPLQAWLARGAALYVCGSRQGMGDGVEAALRDLLGAAGLDRLADEGRYCRDVF